MGDLGLCLCTLYRVQQFPPTLRAVNRTQFISYVILFNLLLAWAQTETLLSARADPAAGGAGLQSVRSYFSTMSVSQCATGLERSRALRYAISKVRQVFPK